MKVVFPHTRVDGRPGLVVLGPLHHDRVVAKRTNQGSSVLAQGLRLVLGLVGLHEGEEGRLAASCPRRRVKHPGEAQVAVEATEEAEEGRSIAARLSCRRS